MTKMKKNIYLVCCLLSIACLFAGCNTSTSQLAGNLESQTVKLPTITETQPITNLAKIPIIDVGNVRYISNQTSREKPYNSVEKLVEVSGFIFSGECVSSKPVYQNNNFYTLSEVKVYHTYKGKLAVGDIVQVFEIGGRTTFGDYVKGCAIEEKAFEQASDRLPDEYGIVEGIDGYFPLKTGEQVLLFAGDASGFLKMTDKPLYGIHGDYDGKLYLQDDGTYARPIPSETDNFVFGKESLVISVNQLKNSIG